MVKHELSCLIRELTNIAGLISAFVQLWKSGVNYVGLYPFHEEKTPSFHVSPSKGIYKCFGCGKSGDVIEFVKEFNGLLFNDALSFLGERCGVIPDSPDTKTDYILQGIYKSLKHAMGLNHGQPKSSEGVKRLETGFYYRSLYDLSPTLHSLYVVKQAIQPENAVYTAKIFTGILSLWIFCSMDTNYSGKKIPCVPAKGYRLKKILSLKFIRGGFKKHGGRPDHNNHTTKTGKTAPLTRIISDTRAMTKENAHLKRTGEVLTLNPAFRGALLVKIKAEINRSG